MVEKFKEARFYTEKNITRNNADNAKALLGDIFESAFSDNEYDIIVSNPPQIPESEMDEISPETHFEPETALLAKENGLEFYKAIIKNYKNSLKKGGMLAFEVGINQSEAVKDLLKKAGFGEISIRKDLGEIERTVSGIKL